MSTGRSDALDAFPRASFLTLFRNPISRPCPPQRPVPSGENENSPPLYSTHQEQPHTPLLSRTETYTDAETDGTDLELGLAGKTRHAYWDDGPKGVDICYEDEVEESGNESNEREKFEWTWLHFLGLLCYVFLLLIVVLKVDMILSHEGYGSGMVTWGTPGQGRTVAAVEGGRDMHFCRSFTNREAPSSRIWRVMLPSSLDECNTQIFTIRVDATEDWKLRPDDEVVLREHNTSRDVAPKTAKVLQIATNSGHESSDEDLGDDRAEEGTLGQDRPRRSGR